MSRNMRLNEDHRLFRIEPRSQPVERGFQRILLDLRRISVIGSQRMPIDYAEVAFIWILHPDPVLQRPDVVAEVQLSGRTHAAEHTFAFLQRSGHFPGSPTFRDTMTQAEIPRSLECRSVMRGWI